ncbi:MAG: hypothetical protein HC945_01860 [Nitrosarchaeum sp.]|nr:hypothetical protein [Nitrosarchaeum sp.]
MNIRNSLLTIAAIVLILVSAGVAWRGLTAGVDRDMQGVAAMFDNADDRAALRWTVESAIDHTEAMRGCE